MTPEAKARLNIDDMLIKAGYAVQDMKVLNPNASLGVVVREFPTESGKTMHLNLMNTAIIDGYHLSFRQWNQLHIREKK